MDVEQIWGEVFTTGKLDFPNTDEGKLKVCTIGLVGLANCAVGMEPPENFDEGMASIGVFLGFGTTHSALGAEAERLMKAWEDDHCCKCGDKLNGHDDDSIDTCRWCESGWVPSKSDDSTAANVTKLDHAHLTVP